MCIKVLWNCSQKVRLECAKKGGQRHIVASIAHFVLDPTTLDTFSDGLKNDTCSGQKVAVWGAGEFNSIRQVL